MPNMMLKHEKIETKYGHDKDADQRVYIAHFLLFPPD